APVARRRQTRTSSAKTTPTRTASTMAAAIIGADGSPYALGPRGRDACARSRSLRGHGIAVVRGGTGACGPVITTGCRPGLAWSAGATAILGLVGCSLFAVSGGSAVAGRVAG